MGAVKSIPVVGEAVTVADAGLKTVAGIVAIPFSDETSEKFFKAAGDSVGDYCARSPVAAAVASTAYLAAGDTDSLQKHWSSVGNSAVELVDGLPVVGHAKGVYHYATGDPEHGAQCMKAATRSTACALAVAATAGTGAVLVAASSVTAGLAADVANTAIDSAMHDEFRPSGHVATISQALITGDPVAIFDAVEGVAFDCTASYLVALAAEDLVQKQNTTSVFRVMDEDAASLAIKQNKVPAAYSAGAGPLGETWISETVEHSKTFLTDQQAKVPTANMKTVQFKVDKNFFKDMKANDCVPQRGSAATNTGVGTGIKNVFNSERLSAHPEGKVNVGIKNANLGKFNDHVVGAKVINPNSWRYENGFTKAASRYGCDVSTAVVVETLNSSAMVDDDDGAFIRFRATY